MRRQVKHPPVGQASTALSWQSLPPPRLCWAPAPPSSVGSHVQQLACYLLAGLDVTSFHPPALPRPGRACWGKWGRWGPRPELPWSTDAILGLEEVRLAPSLQNRSGAVWSRVPVLFSAWEVEVQMRVTGPGRRGAQGLVSGPNQGLAEGVRQGGGW